MQKLRPCISHYRRARAPNRLYTSPEFTITSMYQDFCTEHPDVTISYVYYYKKVKSLNIIFVKLGEEESEKCDLHEKHPEDCHRLSKAEFCEISVDGGKHMKTFDGCDDCVNFKKYITAATEARSLHRKEKQREWAEHEAAMSIDMKKVIMLPRLPGLKQAIFCKSLALFNETFAPVGVGRNLKL